LRFDETEIRASRENNTDEISQKQNVIEAKLDRNRDERICSKFSPIAA